MSDKNDITELADAIHNAVERFESQTGVGVKEVSWYGGEVSIQLDNVNLYSSDIDHNGNQEDE